MGPLLAAGGINGICMNTTDKNTSRPSRRKSDLTLLGTSSQELDDWVYTLEFGVNLSQISFEGLNNYSVSVSRTDKNSRITETLTSVLEFRLSEGNNKISIEGGPPYPFPITRKTLDLECTDLDAGIVKAVTQGIAWLKGEINDDWVSENRRRVPEGLLNDGLAITLLMSSISTIMGGSMECHNKVIKDKRPLFTSKADYINAMYDTLKNRLDDFTVVAINRGVEHYITTK